MVSVKNIQKLENVKIGSNVFSYKGHTYRLTGYIFTYEFKDSKEKKYLNVNKKDATHVSGYGIMGIIAPIEDVIFLDRTTNWSDDDIQYEINDHISMIEEDKNSFDFISKLQKGLTMDEFRKAVVKNTSKSFFKHKR